MDIIAHDDFNRTENPIVGWTKVNEYGDGIMEADAGRAKINKGSSTPPLMQLDATVGTLGARKWSVVATTFDRINIYPVLVDKDNFIMIYSTGGSLGCGVMLGGTQVFTDSISGVTINQGDKISVETVLDGQLTRHILINIYINDVYANYFIIDRNIILENGGCGVQFENIAESHMDDALLEQD